MAKKSKDWLSGLNPEQVEAVVHDYGPLLILAGAGSGKTTVLVARTGRMIESQICKPEEITVLTFTNKAARELKARVTTRVGSQGRGIWTGTFHSWGLQFLRKHHRYCDLHPQFGIIDGSDALAIIRDLLKKVKNSTKENFDCEKLYDLINTLRLTGRFSGATDEYHEMAEVLHEPFVKKLSNLGVVDFEDLLMRPKHMLAKNPELRERYHQSIQQMMVDEFQDTNTVQMQLLDLLVGPHKNISVVGDDDQSIYGWRGAEVKNILHFPREYKGAKVIKLERNYRSTSSILDLANAVIAKNITRHGKSLKAQKANRAEDLDHLPRLFVLDDEEAEADFVLTEILHFTKQGFRPKDIAILYRSNTQGALLEGGLRRGNIAYNITGGSSLFDRKEVKDVMAFLKMAIAPHEVSLRRIINVPARGVGDATLENLAEKAESTASSFLEVCKNWREVGLSEKQGQSIDSLFKMLEQLEERLLLNNPGEELLNWLKEIGYHRYLYDHVSDPKNAEKKWTLVQILARILEGFLERKGSSRQTLRDFLDLMMLRDDPGSEVENEKEVQLMTLHSSKGLEFPVVILVGVEEDILPHKKLGLEIDEERRLFYVGITRAQEYLVLTRALKRKKHGVLRPAAPSRFLADLPPGLLKECEGLGREISAEAREDLVQNFLQGFKT